MSVDLSDASGQTIDHAVLMARWYKATITGLYVYNPIVLASDDVTAGGMPSPPEPTDDDRQRLRERVARCFDSATVIGLAVDVIIDSGSPATCILDHARSLPADLIVIGTHGHGGFEHLVLGSVTEKVIRKATCPVMTVPSHARTTSTLPFKRLLCPVDFSDSSLAALEFAFSLAQEGDADLTIVHVFDGGEEPLTDRPINVPEYRQQLEHDVTARLHALVPDSARTWCRPSTRIAHGKAYREILSVATEARSDLIVMGVHGRNALDLMLFGSTTNQVVRRATCPVLTLRR